MKVICDFLDKQILAALPGDGIKAYGLCVQALKSDQVHPITLAKMEQVAVNDKFDVQYFHRCLNDQIADDDEFSFGSKEAVRHTQSLRTVVIVKQKLTDDYIDKFINAIPAELIISGYKFINLSQSMNKIVDQDAVYKQEFGDTDYEKQRLPYFIYALEYTVDYIVC